MLSAPRNNMSIQRKVDRRGAWDRIRRVTCDVEARRDGGEGQIRAVFEFVADWVWGPFHGVTRKHGGIPVKLAATGSCCPRAHEFRVGAKFALAGSVRGWNHLHYNGFPHAHLSQEAYQTGHER
jgi:hypothetical protein